MQNRIEAKRKMKKRSGGGNVISYSERVRYRILLTPEHKHYACKNGLRRDFLYSCVKSWPLTEQQDLTHSMTDILETEVKAFSRSQR